MNTNKNLLDDGFQLTPRQTEILQQEGLPADINKLTQRQKKSIIDIEEMLQYAERKYGIQLVYVDYTAEKELESEFYLLIHTVNPKNTIFFLFVVLQTENLKTHIIIYLYVISTRKCFMIKYKKQTKSSLDLLHKLQTPH